MDIEVSKQELHEVALVDDAPVALEDGQARLRVDRFGLSTNNITYAVYGDAMNYWNFFPASGGDGWGRVPVWGFADVLETRSPTVGVGERFYGYLPMSSELVVTPGRGDERGFSDVAEHRASMPGAYNGYVRTTADPIYAPDREEHQMVLYPLFFTSFVIDDFLDDNAFFGARQVVFSSASSKTALGAAFRLNARGGPRVVGLTSPANRGFVEALGIYDDAVSYDDIDQLDDVASVYVDLSGNRQVLRAVHERLAASLAYSMTVGDTHRVHDDPIGGDLPGPAPEFLFAPTQIAKRSKEWGREVLDERVAEAWARYREWANGWLRFEHLEGADEVTQAYLKLLDGHIDPRVGFICRLATT